MESFSLLHLQGHTVGAAMMGGMSGGGSQEAAPAQPQVRNFICERHLALLCQHY